ncbi:MAG: cytochrome P460 family protein [Gammaproteobacteria bacterium]|nr:cytochrome P460 family protein [Gammaproteobacteria bacterium]
MRNALFATLLLGVAGLSSQVQAGDIEAGRALSVPCAACHGENGISSSPVIPNLAGQKSAYLVAQLQAFRGGARENDLMNAIAAQLSDPQIESLAAFWSSLSGASTHATSTIPANMERTRLKFPENFQREFIRYDTISFPDRGQVRKYYANKPAFEAARMGQPMPQGSYFLVEVFGAKMGTDDQPLFGEDGQLVEDKLLFYTAMETQPGWGDDFPELLRNADWNYAVFLTDKTARTGVNQAECLACHKPLTQDSYLFTIKALTAAAKAAR